MSCQPLARPAGCSDRSVCSSSLVRRSRTGGSAKGTSRASESANRACDGRLPYDGAISTRGGRGRLALESTR